MRKILRIKLQIKILLLASIILASLSSYGQIKSQSETLKSANSFYEKGEKFLNLNKPDSSLYFMNYALSIYEQSNQFNEICNCYSLIGECYYKKNQLDSAKYYTLKAINLKIDLIDSTDMDQNFMQLALICIDKNEHKDAKDYLRKIISLKISQSKNKLLATKRLSDLYEREFKYDSSIYYLKYYISLKDSLNSLSLNTTIINKDNKEKSSTLKIVLIIGCVILLIIISLAIRFYIEKIKTNKKRIKQNQKIIEQNKEIRNQSDNIKYIHSKLDKLSVIASKTDNAIIIANPDGDIEWINESYTKLYGFTLKELLNEIGSSYIETSSNANVRSIFDAATKTKQTQIYETDVISKSGQNYRIQTTLTPVVNEQNELEYLIAVDSDVTKLKNTEKELQKLLVTKDRFFSIIAHDLKNPFNNIMGISQLLVQGFERMKPEKVKYFHKGLYDISKNGYELLTNLLEWARSQRGSIEFNPIEIDLNKIGNETISLFRTRAFQKEITLSNLIPNDTIVNADLNMLKTIIRNLVSNAIKFTDRGGSIEISTEILENSLKITVRDTGIGIDSKAASRLFKLDEYISTEGTENETGTGLGLILCKEFVDKHQGSIWIESKVGFGSKFNFTLPLA